MIVPKLNARLINDKILKEAEQCYIASPSISESGFNFLMTRISKTCNVTIVTSLDSPTDPAVLWKILQEYRDRVSLSIYTRNFFHASVYVFDMPYRKRIAFIGSGNLTTGGLQSNEELAWRITLEKEVEEVKVWFYKYFDDAQPLTEKIARAYDALFSSIVERENASRNEKKLFMDSITGDTEALRN